MNKTTDGGPAFPVAGFDRDIGDNVTKFEVAPNGGMSLRDYFAAKALVALFSMEANPRSGTEVEPYNRNHADGIASEAYRLADAMLKARQP